MLYITLGIIAWVVLAFWPASIAKKKGYSFLLFFLMSVLISWLVAILIVAMLKDKTLTKKDIAENKAIEEALDADERK